MIHKKIISFLFLILGLMLLYVGVGEIYLISAYLDAIVPISPDTETRLMIILGAAASISGFVGIIRDKTIEV